VARAAVGRPKHGRVRKNESQAAAFAYVAARLNGIAQRDYSIWFRSRLSLAISESNARTAARNAGAVASCTLHEDWLLVDEHGYGLEKVLVRFPGTGHNRHELMAALLELDRVRQVVETEPAGEIVAIAIAEDGDDRRALLERLRRLTSETFFFDVILSETHEPARATWRALAQRAGNREGLHL